MGVEFYTLVGNHDAHYRESLEINSPSLVLGEYNNIHIYSKPTTITIDNNSMDIIPWICKENEQDIAEFIAQSKSDLCLGHFEIENFSMYKGVESHEGLSPAIFEKYERVISGHYHTKSARDNITYAGTPYEMTWQDYNDPKGFHIFDTETRELTFVENVHRVFVRIDYDDTKELVDLSTLSLTDCFVKLVVTSKTNLYKFDNFVQRLYGMGCYEIKIIEDMSEFSDGEVGDDIDLEDTMDVLSNYIDSIDTDADKEQIKTFMKVLYVEALNDSVHE
jgi:DNA repair exonuclease SbcCD nuclease subunit